MMNESIYIYTKFDEIEKESLKLNLSLEYTIFFHDEILENIQFETFANCQYCLGNIPLEWCKKQIKLKWLQLHSAGIDPYNTLIDPPFQITNLRGYFAESVAETTLAGILSFYRGLDRLYALQMENKWVGNVIRPSLLKLHRKNIWVLGGGSIANKFIDLISPFDCHITQTGLRDLKMNAHSIEFFKNLSKNTDIMVFILPEIPELTHYLNQEKLSLISTKTLIVNTGRGSTFDTEALRKSLAENKILGAVLDVTEVEPISVDDALWNLSNVILTQHSAGGWDEENMGKVAFFMENLNNFVTGKAMENMVDCARGY